MTIKFQKLVGLLVGAAEELFEVMGETAFEMISLRGEAYGVEFEAWWTWYSLADSGGTLLKRGHGECRRHFL